MSEVREQLAEVEARIAKLQGRNPVDAVGSAFHLGRVGGSGNPKRLQRLNATRSRAMERTIDNAVALVPLYKLRDRLALAVQEAEDGTAERRRQARAERERALVRWFMGLKKGDTIQPGNDPLPIVRRTRVSVSTAGCVWSIGDVTGLPTKRARALLYEIEAEQRAA